MPRLVEVADFIVEEGFSSGNNVESDTGELWVHTESEANWLGRRVEVDGGVDGRFHSGGDSRQEMTPEVMLQSCRFTGTKLPERNGWVGKKVRRFFLGFFL